MAGEISSPGTTKRSTAWCRSKSLCRSGGSSGNKRKRRILPRGITSHMFSSSEPPKTRQTDGEETEGGRRLTYGSDQGSPGRTHSLNPSWLSAPFMSKKVATFRCSIVIWMLAFSQDATQDVLDVPVWQVAACQLKRYIDQSNGHCCSATFR